MRICRGVEGIVKKHVRIERIVFRTCLLARHRIVKRCRHLCLVGEELAQFHVCRQTVSVIVVRGTLRHALLQSSETLGDNLSRGVERPHVRQLYVKRTLCRPAPFVVVFLKPQLIDPHLSRLGIVRKVAHSDNHCLYLAERRVSYYAHLVVGLILVVNTEDIVIRCHALRLCLVAGFLQGGEHA